MGIFSNILPKRKKDNLNQELAPYADREKMFGVFNFFGDKRCKADGHYADVLFFDCIMLIGHIFNEVTFNYQGDGTYKARFDKFVAFFNNYAVVMWKLLCYNGFVVIGLERGSGNFIVLKREEYRISNKIISVTGNRYEDFCVIKSDVFDCFAMSDFAYLADFLKLIDGYLSTSKAATDSEGHLLFISPSAEGNSHTSVYLTPEEKEEWEKDFAQKYAKFEDLLTNAYFSNRPMNVQQVSLKDFDSMTWDKVTKAGLVICGHFDLPANQLPLFDGSTTRGLTTGNELMIGDNLKYKTFERIMLYFAEIPRYFGINCTYEIKNQNNNINNNAI